MRGSRRVVFVLAATLVKAGAVSAATLTVPATQDAWIQEDAPDATSSPEASLAVDSQPGSVRRTLVQFDLPAIPSCALVIAATLRMHVLANTEPAEGASRVHAVHPLTAPWSEEEVTWNHRTALDAWDAPGGDAGATSATETVPPGIGATIEFDVTGDVAAFVRGTATNHGWLVQDDAEGAAPDTTVGYASRLTPSAEDAPTLLVTYAADDAACDDGNACTLDTCDLETGCAHASVAASLPCADDGNPCTSDACDDAGACAHLPGNAGVECRSPAGPCDTAETCDGASAVCPTDAVLAAGSVCRPSAGDCDVAEECDGSTVTCPADAVVPADTVCRSAAGVCDLAESCDGTSPACPADAKRIDVCREAAGVCDLAESCDGIGNDCPADAFASADLECRPSTSTCDVAELCTGTGADCPPDAFHSCGLENMLCHNYTAGRADRTPISMSDPYNGTSVINRLLGGHVCNPVAIDGSFIGDSTVHYHTYIVDQVPEHPKLPDYHVTNAFGPLVLTVKQATLVMVPAGEGVGAPAPDPTEGVDAFVCYRLDFPAFRNFYVHIEDRFTTPPVVIKVRKPRLLCAAASLNGGPVHNPGAFMICYRHARKQLHPRGADVPVKDVRVKTPLARLRGTAGKDDLVCLKSAVLGPHSAPGLENEKLFPER